MDDIETRLRRRLAEIDQPAPNHTIVWVPEAARDSSADDACDPERARIAWERQQATALVSATARERSEVVAALDRIAAGTYGICEVCTRPIAEDRLAARPTTTRCVEDAS